MLTFLALGAGIGFVLGVSPGPVLTLVVAETLKGGWLRGAAVAAGPLLADGPIILVAVAVMNQLPPVVEPAIRWSAARFSYAWRSPLPSTRGARHCQATGAYRPVAVW